MFIQLTVSAIDHYYRYEQVLDILFPQCVSKVTRDKILRLTILKWKGKRTTNSLWLAGTQAEIRESGTNQTTRPVGRRPSWLSMQMVCVVVVDPCQRKA
jgi:hypothetical protein